MKKHNLFSVLIIIILFGFTGTVQADLNDGLVAYYPFNGNANDESGNGNHGVVEGATLTEDRFENTNRAYAFDGVNDYIIINDGSQFNFSNELSISFWVNPEANQLNCAAILDKSHAHVSNNGIAKSWVVQSCGYSTNNFSLHYCSNNEGTYNNNFALQASKWTNITITKQDSQVSIYKNGIFESISEELFLTIASNGNNPLLIGAVLNYVSSRAFNGKIDEVRIYNRALSESEIQELYNEQPCDCPAECPQAELNTQYEAGKQYCIKNPAACGIVIGGDTQTSYDEGYSAAIADVKANPSAYDLFDSCDECGTNKPVNPFIPLDSTDNCAILESNFDITMPCIDVFETKIPINLQKFTYPDDPFGYYWKLNLE
ncbi:exported hypothetical protein [Desulfamplus magnetovallimortis]|uniref:LamG-like jellyroll fold domain-containing protein n=1 Tax=Desulfamplus magnetovallimortis TaxID=1246637 RepID=A0A1W1H8F3_9BACT|nr:LamG domain-containing protein [Desulfamplus magnetovallimortis]SLM28770.1 exported hypothetical protein [Desulfamplus magnetovallimortis]